MLKRGHVVRRQRVAEAADRIVEITPVPPEIPAAGPAAARQASTAVTMSDAVRMALTAEAYLAIASVVHFELLLPGKRDLRKVAACDHPLTSLASWLVGKLEVT